MSNVAQMRDLGDRRTIDIFAEAVGSVERLRCLLILTICDIKAVGPGVWNGWKGALLRTLYYESEAELVGSRSTVALNKRVTAAQEELRKHLPDWSKADLDAYLARHYPTYWVRVDLDKKVRHARSAALAQRAEDAAGVGGVDRCLPGHDRAHRHRARPSAPAVDHRRQLRGGRRQHRRRPDLHDRGRAGARHGDDHPGLRSGRGREPPGRPHRQEHRPGAAGARSACPTCWWPRRIRPRAATARSRSSRVSSSTTRPRTGTP